MTGVSVTTIFIFLLYSQTSYGQQNGGAHNCQQAVQNNAGFSQTADAANLNIQMQQSAKQAPSSQHSYNMQQLANIPMQTFNVQQPPNFQANPPPANFQPANQAIGLQQVPQSMNLQEVQHDVQQPQSSLVNLQNAPVALPVSSQQTINVKYAPPSITFQQQAQPIQANFQQQAYPVNLQQQQIQQQQSNLQPQTTQQCANLQNSVVVQPSSLHQQTVVHNGNIQQVPQHQGNFQQPSQPYFNIQQQSAHLQQPAVIVQPVTSYQQPVTLHEPIVKQLNVQKCAIQEPHNVQLQIQQTDPQKQVPCQSIGGYQVVSYQKPCQQPDNGGGLPMTLQLSKVSTNPYPTVIAAVPAAIPDTNKVVQRTDHMYLVNPQSYVNSASYSAHTPALVMDNMQQLLSGPTATPINALPNSNPASPINFVISNPNQCAETIDNRSSPLKTSDLGILSLLQGQLPVPSLLDQSTSSFESALLSSILSSIHSPSSSPQYVMANYPQTALGPQSNSQNSKFSLKSLLPLLLNLLQEKYSSCGCQCQCCNCERSQNDNNMLESPKPDNEELQEEIEAKQEVPIVNDDSLEEQDIPVYPRHRGKSKYQNMISDDSAEIEESEDSDDGIETEDIGTGSGDEEDIPNDSSKL